MLIGRNPSLLGVLRERVVRPLRCRLRSPGNVVLAQTDSIELLTLRDWVNADCSQREQAVKLCLRRIQRLDGKIHAWVHVTPQEPAVGGELFHIPFGVKDVIDTKDIPTEFGSPVYKGRLGVKDAVLVEQLRQLGALLLGKTQTAAFAYRSPAPTRNPVDLKRTPGGSSSGSAAAVAAGMVPFAVGTQTCGSVLRPASYCGITGFKPTYGLLPMAGILPLAPSLDTPGFFTHAAADMLLLWKYLLHSNATGKAAFTVGIPEPPLKVKSEMRRAFERAVDHLRAAGFAVQRLSIGSLIESVTQAAYKVLDYEGAQTHRQRWSEYQGRLGPVGDLIRKGAAIPIDEYARARETIHTARYQMSAVFSAVPIILTPAATRSAPRGLWSTGDASMNTCWTALGVPAISIPMATVGLPLGLQLTAASGEDALLLNTAVQVGDIVGTANV